MDAQTLKDTYGPLLRLKEIAKILAVEYKTVRNWVSNGRLPIHTFKVGKFRVAYAEDVANYLAECQAKEGGQ